MSQTSADNTRMRALKLIRRSDGISRSELASLMGLTKAALTPVAADLLQNGFLIEKKQDGDRRGRPNFGLWLVPGAAYALSALVWTDGSVLFEVVDLGGSAVLSSSARLGSLRNPQEFSHQLAEALAEIVDRAGLPAHALRHLAVVLPARIDRSKGIVHWLTPGSAHAPFGLGEFLQDRLGIATTIDNRTTVLARGEHWFGSGHGSENFSFIGLVGRGINAARYVDGQLQTGANGIGSEFAHTKLAFEAGRPCHCGGSGCTIAYASVIAIAQAYAGASKVTASSIQEVDHWYHAAQTDALAGNETAVSVFESAGRALGAATASHINGLDPGRVIIGIDRPELLRLIRPSFDKILSSELLPELHETTIIELRLVSQTDYRLGATSFALEQIYRG